MTFYRAGLGQIASNICRSGSGQIASIQVPVVTRAPVAAGPTLIYYGATQDPQLSSWMVTGGGTLTQDGFDVYASDEASITQVDVVSSVSAGVIDGSFSFPKASVNLFANDQDLHGLSAPKAVIVTVAGGSPQSLSGVLSFPHATDISLYCPGVTGLVAPLAINVDVSNCNITGTLTLPSVETLYVSNNALMTEIVAPNAQTIYASNSGLTGHLSFPTVTNVFVDGCNIDSLSCPNATVIQVTNCGMSTTAIDDLLADAAALGATIGEMYLTGNSVPTGGTGNADYLYLTFTAGWYIEIDT